MTNYSWEALKGRQKSVPERKIITIMIHLIVTYLDDALTYYISCQYNNNHLLSVGVKIPTIERNAYWYICTLKKWVKIMWYILNHLKYTVQWHLIYSQMLHNYVLCLVPNIWSSLKETSFSLHGQSPLLSPHSPWRLLICFLSLWVYLVSIFHINGIIKDVNFCVWLSLLLIMFSRFIRL